MALFPATETAEAVLHLYLWTEPQGMQGKAGKGWGREWWQKLRKELEPRACGLQSSHSQEKVGQEEK